MITLHRAQERHLEQRRKQEVWRTFGSQHREDPLASGFENLESLSENHLPPGAVSVSHPCKESETVTYIHKGALAQEDSTGNSELVHAGEFQRMTIGRGVRHKETNSSRTGWAHIFRISLRLSEVGHECEYEQTRFATAQRRNVLCAVASPDGRQGSLRIHQEAFVYSSVLDPGHHLVHELLPGRSAWLHIIGGEATSDGLILAQGDGVGVTIERSISLTAQEKTEILLVDLGDDRLNPLGDDSSRALGSPRL